MNDLHRTAASAHTTPIEPFENAEPQHAVPLRMAETSWQRMLWSLSVLLPTVALISLPLHSTYQNDFLLLIPVAIAYIALPILDLILGKSDANFSEETMHAMENDSFYQQLTFMVVPLLFAIFVTLAWYAGTQVNSIFGLIALGLSAGLSGGFAINAAHELGHKMTKHERLLAKITLAVPAMGHFCVEHNRGHHKHVATPEDHASSRMGETIYHFMLREVPGNFLRGIEAESARLKKSGKSPWSLSNQILQSYLIALALYGTLIALFGWKMLIFLAVHIAYSWFQLTSANYIEHYGLLREKNANGRYESCKPHHSWNANSVLSNLVLFQLERHSDHHANPTRRYQVLRNFKDVPELPTGYFGMYLVAYIPWLWFRVMDKRVLAVPHINGDLSKVNLAKTA